MSVATDNKLRFISPEASQEAEAKTETVYERVASTIVYPSDATTLDQMNLVEASSTLDFWADSNEDVYDEGDGDAT